MLRWLAKRREYCALIERDATDLMDRFGVYAYSEAGIRSRMEPETIDGNRPKGHWSRVKGEIAKRTGKIIGLNGYEQHSTNY
jgi:hypothetical protein